MPENHNEKEISDMYVEFAGLPGSGKSTLSSILKNHLNSGYKSMVDSGQVLPKESKILTKKKALIKCLRRRDDGLLRNMLKCLPPRFWMPLTGRQYALSEFAALSSRHLELISFTSTILSESDLSQSMKESIWNTMATTFSEMHLISTYIHNSELVIMDEAFAQRCFTLFGYIKKTVPDEMIYRYAESSAPIADQIFWIITDPEVCVKRFMNRYKSRPLPFDFKINKLDLTDSFKSGHGVLECLAAALEARGKTVYRIKGDCDLDSSLNAIINTAQEILVKIYE